MMKLSNLTIIDSLKHTNDNSETSGGQITTKLVCLLDDIAKNGEEVDQSNRVG